VPDQISHGEEHWKRNIDRRSGSAGPRTGERQRTGLEGQYK